MLFTIGLKQIYEPYIATLYPRKGKGGSVFKTIKEARKYCNNQFKVYGVKADWRLNTKFVIGADWRELKQPAKLIKI